MSCSDDINIDQKWPDWAKKAAKDHYSQWDRNLFEWKSFHHSKLSTIQSWVGILLFNVPKEIKKSDIDISEIWYEYPKKERSICADLVDKFKFNEKDKIEVSFTYLYLESGAIVIVFRQKISDSKVIVIDVTGRVYRSWQHFCETNVLPSCQYLAPIDGIHVVSPKLKLFKSPASKTGSKVLQTIDDVAKYSTMTTTTAVALGLLSAGPVALVCGTAGTVYYVVRSIRTLDDRRKHEQSIGFDNAESIQCWLVVGTSAVTGLSTLALAKSAKIIKTAGRYGNVAKCGLQVLNGASLLANASNCAAHFYNLHQKRLRDEEVTVYDAFGICVSLFLTYGAVYNAKQMHEYINGLEFELVCDAGSLTDENMGVISDAQEMAILKGNIPNGNLNFISNVGEELLLKTFNDRAQKMYYECVAIRQACADFNMKKSALGDFYGKLMQHGQNLATLTKLDKVKIGSTIKSLMKCEISDKSTEQVSHVVNNTTTDVRKIDEKLLQKSAENKLLKPGTSGYNFLSQLRPKYEIMFELAKNRIPETIRSDEILFAFGEQLSSLIDETISQVKHNYELYKSNNIKLLGSKTLAEELFSKSGINSIDDFANVNFSKILTDANDKSQPVNHTVENQQIIQKLFALYKRLLHSDTPHGKLSELGSLETCRVLKKSLTEVLQRLSEAFKLSKELYDMNFPFLGRKAAMTMVLNASDSQNGSVMDENENSSVFFDLASEKLDHEKITRELLAIITTDSERQKTIQSYITLTDEGIQSTLVSLCDKFFQKVTSKLNLTSSAEREKRFTHACYYFMENFIALFKEMEKEKNIKIPELLEINTPFFDQRQILVDKFRTICETNKAEIFVSVEKHFRNEENLEALVEKYLATGQVIDDFPIEMYKNNGAGLRIFSINKNGLSNEQDYKLKAAQLFNLNQNAIELVAMQNDTVILKCEHFNVVFQPTNANSMIVMEINTSESLSSE